jgi:S1-C subfamily serine protease
MVDKGEPIRVVGNPLIFEHIETKGTVISGLFTDGIPIGFGEIVWPEAVLLNVSVAGGVSGGPVFDAAGSIVGILVGGAPSGHAIMIPGPTVCRLLGRA